MSDAPRAQYLVRSPNWLGDACMSLPAVRALRALPEKISLTVISPENLKEFWELVPEVDAVIARPTGASLAKTASLIRHSGLNFSRGILFPNSSRSALEMRLGGVRNLTGFRGNWRAKLLQDIVPDGPGTPGEAPPPHQRDKYLAIARHLGARVEAVPAPRPPAPLTGSAVIGICAGAEYGSSKRWPTASFAATMKMIRERAEDTEFVLFGVAKERELSEQLAREFGFACRNLTGETSLGSLIQELLRCHLLISNDTGTMHLADAMGVPVAAIFGSTEPALSGPRGPFCTVIRKHVSCSPCFLRECPLDFRCMKSVTPDLVAEACFDLLCRLV